MNACLQTDFCHNPVHRGRIFFILWLAVAVAGVCTLPAQQISVRSAVPGGIPAKPGTVVATGVSVRNTSNVAARYTSRIELPDGWRVVTRDFPFSLQAGAADIRLLSFSVPVNAPARQYQIRYSVSDSSGHTGSTEIPVIVPPIVRLQLEVTNAPRYISAGNTFSTTFALSNLGNASTSVRLRTRSSADFPVSLDSTVLHLGAREVRSLMVRVNAGQQSGRLSHTLELEAVSGLDSTVVVRASSVVEVVSRADKTEEEYYRYPVTVRLRGVGEERLFGAQVEASGSSSLNDRRSDRLEFLLRGPETQTKSVLGQRDAYNVSYHSKAFDVYGGDMNYALSSLTEFGRYATGAGGRVSMGGLSVGGFYNYNRWTTQNQTEGAGFAGYDVSKNASLGLNIVEKHDIANSTVSTVRGLFGPFESSTLDLEYGTGTKNGKEDNAFAVRLNGNQPWIGYDVRYVSAGADFGGYYQDIRFLSASVNVRASSSIRVESYLRQEDRNLNRDTLQLYAPNDQYYQIGAAYSDLAALYYLRTVRQDKFPNPRYKRSEDAVQGRLGFNTRRLNLYLNGDYGSTHDDLLQQSFPYQRIALNASYHPRGNQNFSLSLEYTDGQDVYTNVDQQRFAGSADAWMLLGQSTQVQLDFYGSRLVTSPAQTYMLAEGSIEHVFSFGHVLRFRARESIIATTFTTNETAYALEYAIPLNVPVRRITSVGQLRGTVTDENGKGMRNVLVNAGAAAAITNAKGQFYFSSIAPGAVFVTIDQASIGLNRITTQVMPVEIDVNGGEEARLDIGVTRSVTITGTVNLFDSKEPALGDSTFTSVNRGGKSGVFVELTNGVDVNRRVTDNHGRFSFADIRPGTWLLKVTGGDIPDYHIVVPDTMTIVASPGDKKDVTIELRPKKRVIKMLQEGAVIPAVPAKPEKKQEAVPAPEQQIQPCIPSYDPKRKGYILQVSSWLTVTKAVRVAKMMEKISGMKSFTVSAVVPKLGKRNRVFLATFPTLEAARAMCAKIRANE